MSDPNRAEGWASLGAAWRSNDGSGAAFEAIDVGAVRARSAAFARRIRRRNLVEVLGGIYGWMQEVAGATKVKLAEAATNTMDLATAFSAATFGGGMIVGARISASAILIGVIGLSMTPWLRTNGYTDAEGTSELLAPDVGGEATLKWLKAPGAEVAEGDVVFAVVSGWAGCRLWAGRSPRESAEGEPPHPIGWGLVVGSIPIAWFGFLSAVHLAHTPDFVYHWGLKAARWVVAGGIDEGFLSRPGAWRMHPDYPQLVTELSALPGLLSGAFDERAALLQAAAVAWLQPSRPVGETFQSNIAHGLSRQRGKRRRSRARSDAHCQKQGRARRSR